MPLRTALRPHLLGRLRCPTCGGPFAVERALSGGAEAIDLGLVRCACGPWPVVRGVLVLDGKSAPPLVPLVASGDLEAIAAHLAAEHHVAPTVFRGEPPTFFSAVEEAARFWPAKEEWLLHMRFWHRTPKYLASLPLVAHLARARPRAILDLASGGGHLGYLASRYAGADAVYAFDASLAYLLLARYQLDGARAACLIHGDAERPLPFLDGALDAVVSSDAFHYMDEKDAVLREVARVRDPDGAVLFTHLHNALCPEEPFQGASLSPDGWRALFHAALGAGCRVLSDEAIRRRFLDGEDNLPFGCGSVALARARSFTVLAGRFVGPPVDLLSAPADAAILNPIYEVIGRGAVLRAARRRLSPIFEEEFDYPIPPVAIEIDRAALADPAARASLRRRGVIVDPPPRMIDAPPVGELF